MANWLTTAEAVRLSGYDVEYIRRLARRGRIKARKWAREWQISRASLLTHTRQMQKQGQKRGRKVAGA